MVWTTTQRQHCLSNWIPANDKTPSFSRHHDSLEPPRTFEPPILSPISIPLPPLRKATNAAGRPSIARPPDLHELSHRYSYTLEETYLRLIGTSGYLLYASNHIGYWKGHPCGRNRKYGSWIATMTARAQDRLREVQRGCTLAYAVHVSCLHDDDVISLSVHAYPLTSPCVSHVSCSCPDLTVHVFARHVDLESPPSLILGKMKTKEGTRKKMGLSFQ